MTKEVFICETPSVRSNWNEHYLEPLKKHFEHVAIVAISDHKASDMTEARFLMFASHNRLDSFLHGRARALAGLPSDVTIDMSRSKIVNYDRFLEAGKISRGESFDAIAAAAEKAWPDLSIDEVANEVGATGITRSHCYWAAFLKGYRDFSKSGDFTTENFYFRAMKHLVASNQYNGPFKKVIANEEGARARLARRYEMIRVAEGKNGKDLDPVILFNIVSPGLAKRRPPWELHLQPSDELVYPLALDGHHRFFVTYLLASRELRALPMWYDEIPGVQSALKARPELKSQLSDYAFHFCQKGLRYPPPLTTSSP